MDSIHVYIHVPFCVDTCGYCDFYRQPHLIDRERLYVGALLREIEMRLPAGGRIETLYFGGGTPSLLSTRSWEAILASLAGRAGFADGAEISIEANPASITTGTAQQWRAGGINRVSVGVQSLNDAILRYLERIHTADVAIRAIECLRAAGIPNVNADLIYGIEGQTVPDLTAAVDTLAPRVHHLSAYALTIAPNTPFGRKGVAVPPADAVADQYERITDRAAGAGLDRYEVSNFARPGFECRHNLNTWQYGDCIALGPSGVGFDGRRRYRNTPNLAQYIQQIRDGVPPESESETVAGEAAFWDRLMLGLRTREGVWLSVSETHHARHMLREAGLGGEVEWTATALRLKPDRLCVLDEFLARLQSSAACR